MPEAPTVCPMELGNYCYLFNKEAGGFLYSNKDLGTRATVKQTEGSRIFIDIRMNENGWDGESYYITSDVNHDKAGNERGFMYIDSQGQLFFNKTKENDDNVFNLVEELTDMYKISLSEYNKNYNPQNYPNTFLGVTTIKKEKYVYLYTQHTHKNDTVEIDSIVNDSTINDSIINDSTINDPIINDSTINDPIINDSTINVPTINDSTINVPTINDSTINVPIINDSTINVPTINDSTINVPIINDSTINVPIINDSTINVPIINDSTINVPIINDSTINDPIINDSIANDSIVKNVLIRYRISGAEQVDSTSSQTTWYFVSQKEYKKYIDALNLYYRALELGKLIEEADKMEGIDEYILINAKFFYSHTFSTISDIEYAYTELLNEVKKIKIANASLDDPFEIIGPTQAIEQTFTNGDVSGWKMETEAKDKKVVKDGSVKDLDATGSYLENSSDETFGVGRIYAVAKNIPNGVYKLSMLAFSDVLGSTYVYAGVDKTLVKSNMIDEDMPYEILTIVNNNELELGLRIDKLGPSCVGLDNVNLYYLGKAEETYTTVVDELIRNNKDYETLIADSIITYYNKNDYCEYLAIKDTLLKSKTPETIIANIADYKKSLDKMAANIETYRKYVNLYNNVKEWLSEVTDSNALISIVSDYIFEEADSIGYNNHGNAEYILSKMELSTEEMQDELHYLYSIYNSAIATKLEDGDDCTVFINNAEFKEKDGWISAVGPEWPTGNVDLFPVVEVKNMVCNIYQEFTNIKDGVYELNLQGVFRPGEEYTEENAAIAQAFAYINSDETLIPCGDVNTAEQASEEFAEKKWNVTVYGLVTDGTLRIGITNKIRSVENCILFAGGPKLTFHAKNAELLVKLIEENIPEAMDIYKNSYCGSAEKDALNYSIKFALAEDDPFEELINLKKNMTIVKDGSELYKKIADAIESLNDIVKNYKINDALKATIISLNSNAANLWNRAELSNHRAQMLLEQLYETISVAKRSVMEEGTPDNPADYTCLIVNNDFDPSKGNKDITWIDGWNTTAMNGYKINTVSYNRCEFELNQTIYGLLKGVYKITVPGYYRAGYFNEEEYRVSKGEETHLATLYVKTANGTFSTPLFNLNEGASENIETEDKYVQFSNCSYAPNSSIASVDYFEKGYYLNELEFEITKDGPVTIGISKVGNFANDYSVIGKWSLWNIETHHDFNAIDSTTANSNVPYGIYSVSGVKMAEPTKGINIIKRNDNSVVKMIIR